MPYSGIFIRQVLGQLPTQPSQGSCSSPDIWLAGQNDPGNPQQFISDTSYAQASAADVYLGVPNFVYLRGAQAGGYTGGSNLYLYYVKGSLALWPQNWTGAGIEVGGVQTPQNWSYAPPVAGAQRVVTTKPLVWTPPTIDTGVDHYCTIAWADNSTADKPVPPPFAQMGQLASFDELMYFLSTHPNMGWRNTVDHPTPPPDASYRAYVSTQDDSDTVNITVNFNNISDGTFRVNVTGDVNWSSGDAPLNVSNYLGGYQINNGLGLQFSPNQSSTLIITYNVGSTPLSKFASITADLTHAIAGRMFDRMLALASEPGVVLPIRHMSMPYKGSVAVRPVFILGRQQWNLQFGTAA